MFSETVVTKRDEKTNRCVVFKRCKFLIWNGIVQWRGTVRRVDEEDFKSWDTSERSSLHGHTHITAAGGGGSVAKYRRPFIREYSKNTWQISSKKFWFGACSFFRRPLCFSLSLSLSLFPFYALPLSVVYVWCGRVYVRSGWVAVQCAMRVM